MEQFSRECLEIDTETQGQSKEDRSDLVKRTLDVEGVVVMDVSHCEALEPTGTLSIVMHYGDPQMETVTRTLSLEEYGNLNSFFAKHPEGKISEGIIPLSLRPLLPTHIQYALSKFIPLSPQFLLTRLSPAVPIFNIDKRPFALLCAYNTSDQLKRFVRQILLP